MARWLGGSTAIPPLFGAPSPNENRSASGPLSIDPGSAICWLRPV
jgi:hypothetical protein